MTKADIVNALYEKIGLSKKETANIVEVVLETLKENLEQGGRSSLPVSETSSFARRLPAKDAIRRREKRSKSPAGGW